tara:strand:- start:1123 stop:2790 length:1668 start_codon:yes stop_codon:yes gene_type:complete
MLYIMGVLSVLTKQKGKIMKKISLILFTTFLMAQTAQVQVVHNSPSPTVDIYVDGSLALEDVEFRASTGLLDLPINTEVGIAPAGGDVIATFPFQLEEDGSYVVVASGIVGNEDHPFNLLASGLESEAEDENSFALKVMHGVTDAPAVDIYADGNLLVENLGFGDFQGYLQIPTGDYTLDITAHGSLESVASFSAPLSAYGGLSGVVYASGFLAPLDEQPSFALVLTTPSGYVVELPATETALTSAKVQIIHNSPYPTVDIYVDGEMALESVSYRASTGLIDLPISTEVGIAPTGGDVIATFPFELVNDGSYVVVASGIVGDEDHPFGLLASGLESEAADDNSFALKVMHGVTDAPAVDIYADGNLLVENLAYGEFQGYLQVPVGDYTLDITGHGSSVSVASFSAPLTTFGGLSGVVYASGFLSPAETDSAFTLVLTTPSGYVVELPAAESALSLDELTSSLPTDFYVQQNYPNPFNPTTTIRYDLINDSDLRITVYDLKGNLIKDIYDGFQKAGRNNAVWNATNNAGETVSSGIYLYKIQVGESFQVRRMMLLK